MARTPNQDQRPATLETPFGKDVLSFVSLDAHEGISTLFSFEIEAASKDAALDFDKALGRNCCVTYRTHKNAERHFNGVLTSAEWLGKRAGLHHYRLRLEPWLALLGYTANCRFFQQLSVVDIIRKVFAESDFNDFAFRTSESYDPIEYCVQYRETNLNFVSRLMERYGLYFFFEHSKGKHEMIIADGRSSHQPVKNLASVPLRHSEASNFRDEQYLSGWTPTRRFETGKVALNDYDYLKPNASLLAQSSQPGGYTKADLEIYDYHASYDERGKGEKFAKFRLEARQCLDFRREGSGDAPSITPGGLITLAEHQEGGENRQYLVVTCHHRLDGDTYGSSDQSGGVGYQGRYLFQPSDRPYRSLLLTPKPSIAGVQTAKVVGKEGEEIDVDEHGRILVQFHWDRDKKQSRRVRVAQTWSGKSWGGIVLPRIGMEVVVEFIEGDPDAPLVVGCVYNGANPPPFALPENKTISGVKSRSSKGDNGYNELIFEDKTNQEKIRIHGEKDLDVTVKNAEHREIGREFKPARGKASCETVVKAGDHVLKVKTGNRKVSVGGSQTVDVTEMITTKAGVAMQFKVGASKIIITSAGIILDAPTITIKGKAVATVTAPVTNIVGSGLLTLKGGFMGMVL
ncbi:MAG: ImpA family type VI secretion-associated [Beijerinckiaceae bacterium]|nr:MAG: ImpA family type VI secretion-associated [Beijerinckiaceae bacterium]